MADGCRAPKRKDDPQGPRCPSKRLFPAHCPAYGEACGRHNQSGPAIAARAASGAKGGRPPETGHEASGAGVEAQGALTPELVLAQVEALEQLSDEQRASVHAFLEYAEIGAAARAAGVDHQRLEVWLQEDVQFQRAVALMRPHRRERVRDYLDIGAAIAARRLMVVAATTRDEDQLVRVARILLKHQTQAEDEELAKELDELRHGMKMLLEERRARIGG